jgi:nucleoside 2-deoxyribosyltransferase
VATKKVVLLTPSQRVTSINEIANRLSGESWALVDLTLKQFNLPITDSWSGDTSSYVMKMIENAPDTNIIELSQHLGFDLIVSRTSNIEPDFWDDGMFRLFISHLAANKKTAATLQDALRNFGISSFVAHNDIMPTTEWEDQIELALSTCDALIALLHDKFHESNWTDQEIGFAMGRGVPVCSVYFGLTPYGFIGRFQAFKANSKSYDELAKEIFDAFRKSKQTQSRMSGILVAQFEESNSFVQAKNRIGYLEELEVWEPAFSKRILAAIDNNTQVRGSFGVPARVEKLTKKWSAS